MKNPDFGVFAKFLDGLGDDDYIDVPQAIECFLCDVCNRSLWLKGGPCTYCQGLEDGKKDNPFKNHTHTWTIEDNPICIKCNIFKKFLALQVINN